MALSERLQTIYDHLEPDQPVWDFCCDHGYLGQAAAFSGRFPKVHFVDRIPSIIDKLEKKLSTTRVFEMCEFKTADAESLAEIISGNLVIAGVGTKTIIHILESLSANQSLKIQRLILAPQRDEQILKEWFQSSSFTSEKFHPVAEYLVMERERKRFIFVTSR